MPVSPSTSTFKVCREHFTPLDFEGPAVLRPDAVPSLFTTHSRSLMDKHSPSPSKRFRLDMPNNRAKQSPMTNSMKPRATPLAYRNTNNSNAYQQRQHEQSGVTVLASPTGENYDESAKQALNESKQAPDMDLHMNCSDEQLSEVQLTHCPVKVRRCRRGVRSIERVVVLLGSRSNGYDEWRRAQTTQPRRSSAHTSTISTDGTSRTASVSAPFHVRQRRSRGHGRR